MQKLDVWDISLLAVQQNVSVRLQTLEYLIKDTLKKEDHATSKGIKFLSHAQYELK